uniref:Uncharacterized protein n=1 Tax=Setaria italica TaxID=4555 RepID=K3Y2Q3_SETIT
MTTAGLWNVDAACCGGGRLGGPERMPAQLDAVRYLFWDSAGHLTQRAAKLIASAFYDGPPKFAAHRST